MSWFKQCVAFWSLATTINKQEELAALKQKCNSWWDIIDFLRAWSREELTPQEMEILVAAAKTLHDIAQDALSNGLLRRYPQLVNIAAAKIVEDARREQWKLHEHIYRYLQMESIPEIDPKIMQEYQRVLVSDILSALGRLKEDPEDTEWFYKARWSVSDLYKSKTFPKSLLEGLSKRFGLEDYPTLISKDRKQVLDEPVLTEWEMSLLLGGGDIFNKDEIQTMINKGNAAGHEYMRSFMYLNDDGNDVDPFQYFIFDEQMNPMNHHLQKRELPTHIRATYFEYMSEDVQNIWGPIIADFGMVMR